MPIAEYIRIKLSSYSSYKHTEILDELTKLFTVTWALIYFFNWASSTWIVQFAHSDRVQTLWTNKCHIRQDTSKYSQRVSLKRIKHSSKHIRATLSWVAVLRFVSQTVMSLIWIHYNREGKSTDEQRDCWRQWPHHFISRKQQTGSRKTVIAEVHVENEETILVRPTGASDDEDGGNN